MRNAHYWKQAEANRKKATDHVAKTESLYGRTISVLAKATKAYDPTGVHRALRAIPAPPAIQQTVLAYDLDTVSAVFQTTMHQCFAVPGKTACLNFASYKEPGGKFLAGSSAQEESLCHASLLYSILRRQEQWYRENNEHKNRGLYLDRALYSPNVPFFTETTQTTCSVITCAAPNRRVAMEYCHVPYEIYQRTLFDRLQFVIDVAAAEQVQTLILGAFGCGVFANDPKDVAAGFAAALSSETGKRIPQVLFAIPDRTSSTFQTFAETFM